MQASFKRKVKRIIRTELELGANERELHAWLLGYAVAWAYNLGLSKQSIIDALDEHEQSRQPKRETHGSDS